MVEFILTAFPVLLLALGAVETGRWYMQKQHLRYAALEAQRVASVTHAEPRHIISSFEEALKPLFSPAGVHGTSAKRRDAYLSQVQQQTQHSPWQMVIQSPRDEHFMDFRQADLAIAKQTGLDAINNNYQLEQHQSKSKGLYSQESIFEANILSIDLIYPYKPFTPGLAAFLRLFASQSNSELKKSYYAAGYLPIQLSAHLGMQSHPVRWPDDPSGKVVHQGRARSAVVASNGIPTPEHTEPCHGLWCLDEDSASNKQRSGSGNSSPSSTQTLPIPSGDGYNPPMASFPASTPDTVVNAWAPGALNSQDLRNPLCDTSICCVN